MELVLGSFAFFFLVLIGCAMYRTSYLHPATLRVYQVTRPQTAEDLMGIELRIPRANELQRVALTFTAAEARDLVALIERALARPAEYGDSLQPR